MRSAPPQETGGLLGRWLLLLLLTTALSLLTACESDKPNRQSAVLDALAPQKSASAPAQGGAAQQIGSSSAPEPALAAPIIVRGTSSPAVSSASGNAALPGGGADITVNMIDADIAAVLKTALGDTIGATYSVDDEVKGKLTLRTNRPVTQIELLHALEDALFAAGYALLYLDGVFRVTTVARAADAAAVVDAGSPGYGVQAISLRNVAPSAIASVLTQFAGTSATIMIDDDRRLLLVKGPNSVRERLTGLARDLDTDSFAGRSFGMFPVRFTDPQTLIDELSAIFGRADPGSARAELQFVALERMDALLAIASRPELIDQVQSWIERLDRRDRSQDKRLFVHYVEHGEAPQIATVLQQLFGGVADPAAPVANGTVAPGLQPMTVATEPTRPADQLDVYSDISRAPPPETIAAATAPPPVTAAAGMAASHGEIKVIADEKNNAIFVLASEQDYRLVQAAIDHLDIGLLQVLIEATIAEVSLTDNLRYGVQWFFENGNSEISLSRVASGAVNPLFPGFGYLLAADNARVVIDALDNVTDVNVISAPQVMVLDNRTAKLEVGDEVPIATQTSVSTIDPDAPIVNSISYRNTGVILTVTPRVNSSGFVTLTIEQEVSDVVPTTTSGIDSPTFRNRRIKSSVTVKDGATIALGGLIRDSQTEGTVGVPVLSQIPVVGALFGTKTDNALRTELLVLLTPRVVRNPQEAEDVTHELKQRLQSLWTLDKALN